MSNTSASVSGFQNFLFKATKIVVILLSLIALLAIVLSTIYLIKTLGNNFTSPIYGSHIEKNQGGGDFQVDTSAQAKVAVTTKYGTDIIKLLQKNNLNADIYTDQITQSILNMPKDMQDSYIDSANKWMDASATSGKTADVRIVEFDQAFREAILSAESKATVAKADQLVLGSVLAVSIMYVLIFVIILALIQIELNTRRAAEYLSKGILSQTGVSEPGGIINNGHLSGQSNRDILQQRSHASKCPKCGAPVTDADIFCEGCGYQLK